jgi:predicted acyltransferase
MHTDGKTANTYAIAAETGAPCPPAKTSATSSRVVSIDALRGFDMFWIIGGAAIIQIVADTKKHPWMGSLSEQLNRFAMYLSPNWEKVDFPAWLSGQMSHVPWAGFHFIDLIFPLFLFLIGAAIPFSLGKRLARGDKPLRIYGHIVLRTVILVVLGMMVNGSLLTYDPAKFELSYSVLQMLALGYLVASILFLNLRIPGQILVTLLMLAGYWALLAFVPVPGHQIGQFAEGCNVGDWVTEHLVGKWRGKQIGWIVGILGHASTAMLGVFAGQLLRSGLSGARKVVWLVVCGLASLALGLFWSGWVAQQWPQLTLFGTNWTEWPVWFPIIKNRWTSSYVLYAGGWSFLLLAAFYLVIDVWQWRRWAFPFVVIGANSIFAYMCWTLGSGVFHQAAKIFLGGLERFMTPGWYALITSAGATLVLWLLLWYLYRNKTYIRA